MKIGAGDRPFFHIQKIGLCARKGSKHMEFNLESLKALGIEEDKANEIIKAHNAIVQPIQARAGELPGIKEKLARAEKSAEGKEDAQAVQAQFDAYKRQVEGEKTARLKQEAVTAALKGAGADERAIKLLLKGVNLDAVELDEKNGVKDQDALLSPIKTEYADFFGTTQEASGAGRVAPPVSGSQKKPEDMSYDEYRAFRHAQEEKA